METNMTQFDNNKKWIYLNNSCIIGKSAAENILISFPQYKGYGIWFKKNDVIIPNKFYERPTKFALNVLENAIYSLEKISDIPDQHDQKDPTREMLIDILEEDEAVRELNVEPFIINDQKILGKNLKYILNCKG